VIKESTKERGPAVLIVEDERIVAKDLQQTLNGLGYNAYAIASSAEDAIARASERCPDVVLMDIRIEGSLDGIQTAELLKRRFDVPVVFLTAHSDDATLERAKRVDPHGYLIKPLRTAELRSALEMSLYRHGMERRMRERERWHTKSLESIGDAVVTVDLAGRVTFMNPAAEKLTGTAAADALGKPVRDVVKITNPSGEPFSDTPLTAALREDRAVELMDANLLNVRTGAQHAISDTSMPVIEAGQRLGAVMVFRDVSDQRNLQKQLELANQLASLGTMAAGVAHEINNPLSVVTANADFIAQELKEHRAELVRLSASEPAKQRCEDMLLALHDVRQAAARIGSIVDDLRAFSRPAQPQAGVADVVKCLSWALRTTAHEFQQRAQLITHFGPVPHVPGDEAKLGQVFINLLVNAAHAMAPGQADQNRVTISVRTDERGWAVIEIADTGCGIPAADLPRIFDPFFTTRSSGGGTGLGLSICHGIVTAFGGELRVSSEPGTGSRFTVYLPSTAPRATQSEPRLQTQLEPRRSRLLIIDDEQMVLRVLERVLRNHDLMCTQSARAGLDHIRNGEQFDLILTDITMPSMTGIQFYEELLAHYPEHAKRVVFLSGGAVSLDISDFLQSVSNPRIEKPFDSRGLRAQIANLLAQGGGSPQIEA
jgi:two-component system cell cycle sensor histidine kinase/response regulator CckA